MCVSTFLSHPLAARAWAQITLPIPFALLPSRFCQYSCRLVGLSAAAAVCTVCTPVPTVLFVPSAARELPGF
ncbi:hypothetical protein [Methanimicrococcus hacksteinii]|uniref:hypothetical protein n=1 Tax=Methanimicrococcus hacksteinii TaxID=3028293 RepID=UPI00298F175E|nr:hypothetical protein [Methanimicrococcus sp. At1]